MFLLVLAFLLPLCYMQRLDHKNVLKDLYNNTNGPEWTYSWDFSRGLCNQYGVTCNSTGHVTALALSGNNLKGVIPSSISSLELFRLELANNKLYGVIPVINSKNIIFLKSNSFNCPIANYSMWSQTTDYAFYSKTNIVCKGSTCVTNPLSGANECEKKSIKTIEGILDENQQYSRVSLKSDSTCCLSPSNSTHPYSEYGFMVSMDGYYEISIASFSSEDQDTYIFLYKSSLDISSPVTGVLLGNDDISSENFLSTLRVYLKKHERRVLIVSTYAENSYGSYVAQFKGPSNFELKAVCEEEIFANATFPMSEGNQDVSGTCLDGFVLSAPDTSIKRWCLENGRWSHEVTGKCINNEVINAYDILKLTNAYTNLTEVYISVLEHIENQKILIKEQDKRIFYLERLRSYFRFRYVGDYYTSVTSLRQLVAHNEKLFAIHDSQVKVYNLKDMNQAPYILGIGLIGSLRYATLTKKGDILIADYDKNIIWKIPVENPLVFEVFMSANTGILNPTHVLIDEDDRIIVSEYGRGALSFFDSSFNKLYSLSGFRPFQIAISPITKEMYLCDYTFNRLSIFRKDLNGNYYFAYSRNIGFALHTIMFDELGNYVLPDYTNGRHMVYEADGSFVASFGMSYALSIFKLSEDRYVAADHNNGIIRFLSTSKTF